VHFWEEPKYQAVAEPGLEVSTKSQGVTVITPVLPPSLGGQDVSETLRRLLDEYIDRQQIEDFIAWYYTPMALEFSDHLTPVMTIYDCMDELSAFQGAPPELVHLEQQLFSKADIVFAGGASLFAMKRNQHPNVHLFPSSIDGDHFAKARLPQNDPADQEHIPHPRIGFYGVLDERLDRDLLREVAAKNPDWHFVLIGPVVKIREEDLPAAQNLHYLGQKSYEDLPRYLANWDVAMLPFARNKSTTFISPTKTPEYLAGGKPVVSTPIQDVVKPYGEMGLVKIAGNAVEFAEAVRELLERQDVEWLARVDEFLAGTSWDRTFNGMWNEIQRASRKTPEPISAV
jgi:glycosyltransferase involved in cell wall biosynthesis